MSGVDQEQVTLRALRPSTLHFSWNLEDTRQGENYGPAASSPFSYYLPPSPVPPPHTHSLPRTNPCHDLL